MGLINKVRNRAQQAYLSQLSLGQLRSKLAAKRGVITLCYHALDQSLTDYPYRTSAAALEEHLRFLMTFCDILPAHEAIALLRAGGLRQRSRPVAVITFDDGYMCNWTQATPVLEALQIPAMLFAPKDLIMQEGDTYVSSVILKKMHAHPLWTVGPHGVTHNVLTGFLQAGMVKELIESRRWLDDLLGEMPLGFAYPQGQLSPAIVAEAAKHYQFGFATDTRTGSTFDPLQIRRYCPQASDDPLKSFAKALLGAPWETGKEIS